MVSIREPNTASALTVDDRRHQVGHHLRGVLAVAVEQHHDVPAVVDGVAVAGLLVAAVAEVASWRTIVSGMSVPSCDVLVGDGEGGVGGVVVLHQHLGQAGAHLWR